MLFLKDEYFENSDYRELNAWASAFGAERSPRDMILAFRFAEACEKFQVKNVLALWCLGVTKTEWFSRAPKDRDGQVRWCEALASEYARLGDIRLLPLTEDERVIMTLVWTQASARLNDYAKFKKPKEPKLPDPKQPEPKPVENREKKEEPKVEGPEAKAEPRPTDQKSPVEVEEPKKSATLKIIGAVATVLAAIVAWLPMPAALASVLKVIFNAIASVFR